MGLRQPPREGAGQSGGRMVQDSVEGVKTGFGRAGSRRSQPNRSLSVTFRNGTSFQSAIR
jgi:hypothetical protein